MGQCYLGGRLVLQKVCYQIHLLFLNVHELLLLLTFVVLVLLLGVMYMLVHGLHEGVYFDALLDSLLKLSWAFNRWSIWRQRS